MSLDTSKISVISAKRVDPHKLSAIGDSAGAVELPKVAQAAERKCNLCCVAYGSLLDAVMVFFLTGALTGIHIFAEKRVNYSLNGVMRQIAWLAFPGVVTGMTMHYFLSEAMWSGKRNSWGQAWTKAMAINTMLWCGGVGAGTLLWRKALPLTAAGRRLYHRHPVSTEPLEARVLRSSRDFFGGMGWTYWLSGVASGHMGLLTVVSFCVYNDRPYLMMAPDGAYSRNCMPLWRRDQLAHMANVPLPGAAEEDGGSRSKSFIGIDGIRTGKGIETGYKAPATGASAGGRNSIS